MMRLADCLETVLLISPQRVIPILVPSWASLTTSQSSYKRRFLSGEITYYVSLTSPPPNPMLPILL